MAIAMFASFRPGPSAPVAGTAQISFSELEAVCDISRRYVAHGLAVLKAHELITVDGTCKVHRHHLARPLPWPPDTTALPRSACVPSASGRCGSRARRYEDAGWAKLPRAHLLEAHRFSGLGIRGALYLNALKLYLALVTFRPNDSPQALLSYDKIETYTGMPRSGIRRAIDVLVNHQWLSLAAHASTTAVRKSTNVYVLRGDFWGRRHQNYVRASLPERAPAARE
jgi:hypothetical protein